MHAELPHGRNQHQRLVLWISPFDEHQAPIDPVFLEAAADIGTDFFLYRAAALQDDSRALELAERAVHCASRARKLRPIEDPVAYLFRIFTRLVDQELARSRRFVPLPEELLGAIDFNKSGNRPPDLDRLILWREVLESLDDTMQWVLRRLRSGFSIHEIADDLGVSPNTLSKRLSRVRRELRERLDRKIPPGPRSEIDGSRIRRRPPARGNLPDDGRGNAKQFSERGSRGLPERGNA